MYKKLISNRHCNLKTPSPDIIEGTTLTIPNLAPTIYELIQNSLNGESFPLTSTPLFDKDDNYGLARIQGFHDISDLKAFAESQNSEKTLNLSEPISNFKEGEGATPGATTTDANKGGSGD